MPSTKYHWEREIAAVCAGIDARASIASLEHYPALSHMATILILVVLPYIQEKVIDGLAIVPESRDLTILVFSYRCTKTS